MSIKVLIVGGVAGGASTATRARRLSEEAEIILFERGEYISYANCGLPYYIGKEITERDDLLVTTPELLINRFNIDVRTFSEVTGIDRANKQVTVRNHVENRTYTESYDKLVLCPGGRPIKPPLPGIDLDSIFILWTIPDSDRIKAIIDEKKPRSAVVIGGGFIGLEMAENLIARGMEVTVVEMLDQVMPPLDFEMASIVHSHIIENGCRLHLSDAVSSFRKEGDLTVVTTKGGAEIECDMVILSIGVRPNNELARDAGLELGDRGGIRTNPHMLTSDPDIYAAGDVVEVKDFISGQPAMIPLAGPANKQGRIVADNIFGRRSVFKGTREDTRTIRYALPHIIYAIGFPCVILSRIADDERQAHFHARRWQDSGGPDSGNGGSRQTHRRSGNGHKGRHDGLRPGGTGTRICAPLFFGQGPREHGGIRRQQHPSKGR